ncbi:TlpA family protein disulfide reductase [Desulfotomaculum sp. 1211_IL3151]|uniref:TlpA family protein disulfide reductase n=1 Tax=Desulfotomaculum sp. 1211_IL3151 TaxID=3084055 RepID=UPI002FD88B9F
MKRKMLTVLILGAILISLVGCNQSTGENSKQTNKTDAARTVDVKFIENGIEFNLPDKWKESQGKNIEIYRSVPEENITGQIDIRFISDETNAKGINLDKELKKQLEAKNELEIQKAKDNLIDLYREFKEVCTIVTLDKSRPEGEIQKDLFAKYENKDLLDKEGNFEFYLLFNNKPNTRGLTEKSKQAYEEVHGEIKAFKGLINTFRPVSKEEELSKYKKVEFRTKTLDNKEINSSIFKDSKLTMINVWATFCNPCIEELPDLQRLYEEVKGDKINVIGIVSDTPDSDNEELARKILSKAGVKYTNIIPDEQIVNSLLNNIVAVPTTLFVDSEGNIIGDLEIGSMDKEGYKKELQERLENMK